VPAGPATERGRRARAALLVAARRVFERDGFLDARVTDISAEAGVSHGSFYTYFGSKTGVFRALVTETMDELYASLGETGDHDRSADPTAGIERANRRFVLMYQENTALMALFEQVATIDPEVRALRHAVRQRMVARVTRSVERLQQEGQADRALDARCSANALVAMVNGLVHHWLVLGEELDQEQVVSTLTRLWTQALGLPAER
jgi:AcrR family transcriptional regulator